MRTPLATLRSRHAPHQRRFKNCKSRGITALIEKGPQAGNTLSCIRDGGRVGKTRRVAAEARNALARSDDGGLQK